MLSLDTIFVKDWLESPTAIRGILVEVSVLKVGASTDSIRYLSSFSYTTSPSDSPANTEYESIINGGMKYTEKLDLFGNPILSGGDIEINNPNGEYDSWLLDTWTNRTINVYFGDPRWPRADFILIFSGVVSGVDSRNRNTINLQIKDKTQRLNTPISELKYADVAPYPNSSNQSAIHDPLDPLDTTPDVYLPTLLGEAHNITPVLIDAANGVYCINFGYIKGIIEVRDNGVPLSEESYEVDKTKGTIKILYPPAGVITISAKGDNLPQYWDSFPSGVIYRQTAGQLIRRLVTGYGKTVVDPATGQPTMIPSPDRFTDYDIDIDNFEQFELTHKQPVGVYSTSRENLLTICQQLASSVGAQLSMSRLGKLQLKSIVFPTANTTTRIIDGSNMLEKTLQIGSKTAIQGSIKLGFTKNWTVQNSLSTNLPYEHKVLFAQEYSTTIQSDAEVILANKLTAYPAQQDTLLLSQTDAFVEANRRLNIFKKVRTIYKFTGYAELLTLNLGDPITLINTRFGLTESNGKGIVLSLSPDWVKSKIIVEVLI